MKEKTKAQAEATGRKWIAVKNRAGSVTVMGDKGAKIIFSLSQPNSEDEANADLIVKAVNEYEALNAVAEAAKDYFDPNIKRAQGYKLREAVDALATLRSKEGK